MYICFLYEFFAYWGFNFTLIHAHHLGFQWRIHPGGQPIPMNNLTWTHAQFAFQCKCSNFPRGPYLLEVRMHTRWTLVVLRDCFTYATPLTCTRVQEHIGDEAHQYHVPVSILFEYIDWTHILFDGASSLKARMIYLAIWRTTCHQTIGDNPRPLGMIKTMVLHSCAPLAPYNGSS